MYGKILIKAMPSKPEERCKGRIMVMIIMEEMAFAKALGMKNKGRIDNKERGNAQKRDFLAPRAGACQELGRR